MRLIYKLGVLSAAALVSLNVLKTDAQTQPHPTQTQGSAPQIHPGIQKSVAKPLPAPTQYDERSKSLQQQIEIPNMPAYPDKSKYTGGKVLEIPGSNTYTMNFLTIDEVSRVREWYIQALASYSWKQTIHPTPNQVSGMSTDGSGVNVTFTAVKQPPYKTMVMVMYHQRVKQR